MAWSTATLNYVLLMFNVMFFCSGVIILSMGISVNKYFTTYEFFLDNKFFSTAYLFIAVGAIVFSLMIFGRCGAKQGNLCVTVTYSVLLGLVFVLSIAAGISGYILGSNTSEFLLDKLNDTMYQYEPFSNATSSQVWDELQSEFKCCGTHNYTDWYQVEVLHEQLPMACCGPQWGFVGGEYCNKSTTTLYQNGCVEGFGQALKYNSFTIATVAIILAFIQLLQLFFACHIAKQIKKDGYQTM